MPLGMEVGLSSGDFVLDEDPCTAAPLPARKGIAAPTFRPMSIVVKQLDRSICYYWYGGRPEPRRHCVRLGPSSPNKGTSPIFVPCLFNCGQMAEWIKMPLGKEVQATLY